ncbi:MAG: DUF6049 family protein [Streptosporangiaceae bacterium]
MARRARGALAAILALAAVALPAALIGAAEPASAATTQSNQPPATVTITSISPQWASPTSPVTVTGIVTNTSPAEQRLIVQLFDSSTPVSSITELQQSAAGLYGLADLALPTAPWQSGLLRPGASATWSARLPASSMAMTSFGVYPVAAQVSNVFGTALNLTESFLPYVPAKNGTYGSTVPAPQKIAWVWPLVDQPLLDEPWQGACEGQQAAALGQSLTSGGRLDQLLDAATAPVGSAATAAAQAQLVTPASGHPAKTRTAQGQQPQSVASYEALTWAIDPALAANVSALAQCGALQPQWARAASAWLSRLKSATAGQPAFATPFGDPDVATLIGAGHAPDIQRSFSYGRSEASQILGRSFNPAPAGAAATDQQQAAGLAWSADPQISYGTLEDLAALDVGTVLLSSSAFPAAQTSVLRTLDGSGSYLNVLLANDSLTSVLGAATKAPGSAAATVQDFLAETALMAQQDPASPIVVAPPERWQPPPGVAASLLSAAASAPWLSPASLTSLTGAKTIPIVQAPSTVSGPTLSQPELDRLKALDRAVTQLQLMRAQPDPDLYLAVSTVESSAYAGRFTATALDMIAMLTSRIEHEQEQGVHIVAENRITLGGLRGSVPVSVDNQLGYAVQVALRLDYDTTNGTRVTASPPALLTVPRNTAETIKLRVSASQTGSTTITMTLANRKGQLLAVRPVRMTVQTTQVGMLGLIILGAALGVFLLASAARAIRRGGTRPITEPPVSPTPSEDEQSGQSSEEAAPDTVVPEHRELGTAGTPRPR